MPAWKERVPLADGKVSFAYSRFLGLDKDRETGKIVVNQEQAETVKLIFRLFLEDMTPHAIAAELTRQGIKTPAGKDVWNQETVRRMLSNEKYKGDALFQKQFTVDFLQKKVKKNEGEVPQYYVEGNHEAIISPAVFDMVQAELARRAKGGSRYSGVTIFSNRIKCGECGHWYGSKVWHSTDKYRRIIWQCNHKFNGGKKCSTPHLTEEEIKAAFIKAFNKIFEGKKALLENLREVRSRICDTSSLEAEQRKLANELQVLADMVQNCISENARIAQNQAEYQKRYDELVSRYEEVKAKYDEIVQAIHAKRVTAETLDIFAKGIESRDAVLTEFDKGLWGTLVECMTVYGKGDIGVTFKDGTEIRI